MWLGRGNARKPSQAGPAAGSRRRRRRRRASAVSCGSPDSECMHVGLGTAGPELHSGTDGPRAAESDSGTADTFHDQACRVCTWALSWRSSCDVHTCISLSDRVREHRSDAFYPTDFVCQWAAPRFTECERLPAGVGMHGARKACSNATRRRAKCSSRFYSSGRPLACWIRLVRECHLQCRPPR